MLAYTLKRLMALIPTLLAASILVFLFIHLIPGDPASILLGDTATPEDVAALTREMGLDKPIWKQYLLWLGNVLQGDLGTSVFFREPVLAVIGDGAETSILLATMTMFWIVLFGIPIGILSATKHGTWVDQVTSGGAMLFASVPTFWLGLYLILIFSVALGWFPSSGFPSISDDGGLSNLRYLILPSLTLAAPNAALIIRLVRASMLDVSREDHVRTARAKGLHPANVAVKHVFSQCLDRCGRRLRVHFRSTCFRSSCHGNCFFAARDRAIGCAVDPTPRLPGHPGRNFGDCRALHGY